MLGTVETGIAFFGKVFRFSKLCFIELITQLLTRMFNCYVDMPFGSIGSEQPMLTIGVCENSLNHEAHYICVFV